LKIRGETVSVPSFMWKDSGHTKLVRYAIYRMIVSKRFGKGRGKKGRRQEENAPGNPQSKLRSLASDLHSTVKVASVRLGGPLRPNCLHRGGLLAADAGGKVGGRVGAEDAREIGAAESRVRKDAVFDAIELVALAEHFRAHDIVVVTRKVAGRVERLDIGGETIDLAGEEVPVLTAGRSGGRGRSVEAEKQSKKEKKEKNARRSTDQSAVEILRVLLHLLEPLLPTGRASEPVGLVLSAAVVSLRW
jgi:hypothetical protein